MNVMNKAPEENSGPLGMQALVRSFSPAKTLCVVGGGGVLVSACLVNPWTIRLFRNHWIDYRDVSLEYAIWALGLGIFLLSAGILAPRGERVANALLIFISLTAVVLLDRGLLVFWGRSPWITDPVLHYRHRPNAHHTFQFWYQGHRSTLLAPGADQGVVRINRYGQHDDDFAPEPIPGELRGLMVGDSVTMGHGVDEDDTFANQLENLLGRFDMRHSTQQIINAGVQGYETEQEYHMFAESLDFGPRFAFVGFCFNDVPSDTTSQYGAYRHESVRGHGLWLRYLLTETGIGLSVQKFRQYRFAKTAETVADDTNALRRSVVLDHASRQVVAGRIKHQLQRIYDAGRARGVDVGLLILPAKEQLFRPELQAIHTDLVAHADNSGAAYLDLTAVFEGRITWEVEQILQRKSSVPERGVLEALRGLQANLYYLDDFHLTPRGHRLVAWMLARYLDERYELEFDANSVEYAFDTDPILSEEVDYRVVIPPDYPSVFRVCAALEYLGQYEQAAYVYETVLRVTDHPGLRSFLHYLLGSVRLELGQREVAANQLRNSVALLDGGWPVTRPGGYTRLGRKLLELGLPQEAVTAFRLAQEVDPNDQLARSGLGRSYYVSGDNQAAIVEYEQARKLGLTSAVEFNLALAYLSIGDAELAKQTYAGAIANYGAEEGLRVGALDDLRALAERSVQREVARQIIGRYWQ